MLELKLYEVVSELNSRAEMGRVVVPPPLEIARNEHPRETGNFFFCCNRAYLTLESFEKHKSTNCLKPKNNEKGDDERSFTEIIRSACKGIKKKEMTAPVNAYTCTVVDVTAFIKIRKTNNGLITLNCRKCCYNSPNAQNIARHIKAAHSLDPDKRKHTILDDASQNSQQLSFYFECEMCSFYRATQASSMILHIKVAHAIKGQFPCLYCTCRYETQVGLTLHTHKVHREEVTFTSCNNKTVRDDIRDSHSTVMGSVYDGRTSATSFVDNWVQQAADQLQRLEFEQNNILINNTESVPKTIFSIFKCGSCPRIFDSEPELMWHNSYHYIAQPKKEQNMNIDNNDDDPANSVQNLISTCKFCRRTFETFELCDFHESGCSDKTPLCQNTDNKDSDVAQEPFQNMNSKMETSNDIGISENLKYMTRHSETCFSEIGSFKKSSSKDKELDSEQNICDLCGFIATEPMELGFHLKVAHVYLGVECECGCSFATATELTNHKRNECRNRSSTNFNNYVEWSIKQETSSPINKKYTCNCGEAFETRPKFRSHKMICNDICIGASNPTENCEGVTNIQLLDKTKDIISVGETLPHDLASAEEGKFICELCNKNIRTARGLRSHLVFVHKRVQDFSKCELCGYTKLTPKSYKEHYKRCHTGTVKCPDCVCSFRDVNGLFKHAIIMHKKTFDKTTFMLRCQHPGCDFVSYNPANLKHHQMKSHAQSESNETRPVKVSCHICNLETRHIQYHISTAHVENGINCPECKICSFRTKKALSRHLIVIHGLIKEKEQRDPAEYPVACTKCDFRSKDSHGVNVHCIKVHGSSILLPKNENKRVCNLCHVETTETLTSHMKRYHVLNGFKCLITDCTCSFETNSSRARHMLKVHQIKAAKKCAICKYEVTGTMKYHMQTCHVENGFKCKYSGCRCSFQTKQSRLMHMKKRHQYCIIKQSVCPLCRYSVSSSSFEVHLLRSHVTGGLPCSFCCCSFENEQGRLMHLKMRHKVKVPTNCTLCGIKPAVSMNAHLKQSHVAFGIPCGHCGCAFKTERIRIGHLARYHNIIENLSPKVCSLCELVIRIPITKHMERHHVPNGYPCSYCNWSLPSESGLAIHMFKKHGEHINGKNSTEGHKKQCAICGVKVTESMKQHIERNHLSINHFKCYYCCCKFSTNMGRTCHIKLRHPKELTKKHIPKRQHGYMCNRTRKDKSPEPEPKPIAIIFPVLKTKPEPNSLAHLQSFVTGDGSVFADLAPPKSSFTRNQLLKTQNDNATLPAEEVSCLELKPLYEESKAKSPLIPKELLTCPHCGYLASYKSHLNIHLQKSHVRNSPFLCNFCTCKYSSDKELHRHIKIFHSKEQCELELISNTSKSKVLC